MAEASSRTALAFLLAGVAGACLPYLSSPCFEGDPRCQLDSDGGDDGGDGGGGTCTAFNCHGCCQGNACLPPTLQSNAQCGAGGVACGPCMATQSCQVGVCVAGCGPGNCTGGCCAAGVCIQPASQSDTTCGSNGAACQGCAQGTSCTDGGCVGTPVCNSSTCNGCCAGTVCVPVAQETNNFCGLSGVQCAGCGGGVCVGGACSAPDAGQDSGNPTDAGNQTLVPSNGAPPMGVTGALNISSGSSATLNSDTGQVVINGFVFRQPGAGTNAGINLRANATSTANVLEVLSMDVAATATLRIAGTSAIILLSDTTVHIGGLVDVSAGCSDGGGNCGGPGGGIGSGALNFAGGCGPGGDGNLSLDCHANPESAGGGGGGLGAAGANGGNTTTTNCTPTTCCDKLDGGPAGVACGTAPLVPLVGGSGGGASANSGGGGGGGALQITAMQQLTMDQSAAINAAGGGGLGASQDRFGVYQSGGGGGGSGGAVLLESPTVSIGSGVIIATNGGGGGSGDTPGAGQAGQLSITSAAQGGCDAGCQDVGGNGGVGSTPPTGGTAVGAHVGSGGGGAVGRIRLNATTLTTTGALFSPAPSTGQPQYQ